MVSTLAFALLYHFVFKRFRPMIFPQSKTFPTSQHFSLIKEVFHKQRFSLIKEVFHMENFLIDQGSKQKFPISKNFSASKDLLWSWKFSRSKVSSSKQRFYIHAIVKILNKHIFTLYSLLVIKDHMYFHKTTFKSWLFVYIWSFVPTRH